jgi:hypothetical protein
MPPPSLVDIIRQYVSPLNSNGNGWYATRCLVCNDHAPGTATFKGYRGNFHLEGEIVGYNCYNCNHVAKYDPSEYKSLSKNMREVIEGFNIPEEVIRELVMGNYNRDRTDDQTLVKKSSFTIHPSVIELPDTFYKLTDATQNDKFAMLATHHLKNERGMTPQDYEFYLCSDKTSLMYGRLIIPLFKDNQPVYYDGMALLPSATKKYITGKGKKNAILYNYEAVQTFGKMPLFVLEGFFDAFKVGGVALLGRKLTEHHEYWLKKTNRRVIFIPDATGDSDQLGQQMLDAGFEVSLPDFGHCKDVCDAFKKYDRLTITAQLMNNVKSGRMAEMAMKLWIVQRHK